MDVSKILTELRQEREQIEEAIYEFGAPGKRARTAPRTAAGLAGRDGKKTADALQAAKINFRTPKRRSDSLNPAGSAAFQR